jgi:diaminopropionate ammonia-lyase
MISKLKFVLQLLCTGMTELFINPFATRLVVPLPPSASSLAFHRKMPGYEPTPLMQAPALATQCGVGSVSLKLETVRFGLPSFKILGASYAIYSILKRRYGIKDTQWSNIEQLTNRAQRLGSILFVAATDGNHGRAVARMARMIKMPARIYVPAGTTKARIDAIQQDEAEVRVVDGDYDEAVQRAAKDPRRGIVLVQDTSWPGYQEIPRHVVEGYSTLFQEMDSACEDGTVPQPDIVLLPLGVGSMAEAAVRFYRRPSPAPRPLLIGYEPVSAACALASVRAGHRVSLPHSNSSIMAGLNCGTLSLNSWPCIMRGMDAFLTLDDRHAIEGMRTLASLGIRTSETGGACAGALSALFEDQFAAERKALGITASSKILLIVTEGITDPAAYISITSKNNTSQPD